MDNLKTQPTRFALGAVDVGFSVVCSNARRNRKIVSEDSGQSVLRMASAESLFSLHRFRISCGMMFDKHGSSTCLGRIDVGGEIIGMVNSVGVARNARR